MSGRTRSWHLKYPQISQGSRKIIPVALDAVTGLALPPILETALRKRGNGFDTFYPALAPLLRALTVTSLGKSTSLGLGTLRAVTP